ncbi:hypothetical protein DYB25_005055 [Aphanomyces astaci]|uniref:Uncharacterized protein n=1 Tax=Aphanomyces astaci TaxID=112090 RepID=A0A397BIT8_APHAT|nr:hypothetical protein DYB25_005055 [Aphanomyces astaci]
MSITRPPSVVPSNLDTSLASSTSLPSRVVHTLSPYAVALASFACAILLVVDIAGNNWELNDFLGNARHLFTPLLTTFTIADLERDFSFPELASASSVSMVGQFMVQSTLDQVHASGTEYYALTMSSYVVTNSINDICSQLVDSYPVPPSMESIRLGNLQDNVSFIRGDTFTHVFGHTATAPFAPPGSNSSVLKAMGYTPARVSVDMRLTTAIPIPPPSYSPQHFQLNVTMYRFFSKAFCSGCHPGTELGMDTCAIEYSYDDTTKQLTVHSSHANFGKSVHVLAMVFLRRYGPVVGLYIRAACVALAIGAYAASQKTVRWTDAMTLSTWKLRLLHITAPPVYRQVNHAFDFMYFCFNSDVFVMLYSVAILLDEDVAMVYARVVWRWYTAAAYEGWMELRLLALAFRWLWLNLGILKFLKWLCNVVASSRYNGSNFIMGWLTFSSTGWIYLTVIALAMRTPFIEHGNSVRMDVTSTTEDLDTLFVEFESSWYLRGLPSVLFLMVANLVAVLTLDHVVNRQWWRLLGRNSLTRQFMFNSTSILCELKDVPILDSKYSSTVTIQARTVCTIQWFLLSHLVRFGLPEEPSVVRRLSSAKVAKKAGSNSHRPSTGGSGSGLTLPVLHQHQPTGYDTAITATADGTRDDAPQGETHEMYLIVQDQGGHVYIYDSAKREVPALGVEAKVAIDAILHLQ